MGKWRLCRVWFLKRCPQYVVTYSLRNKNSSVCSLVLQAETQFRLIAGLLHCVNPTRSLVVSGFLKAYFKNCVKVWSFRLVSKWICSSWKGILFWMKKYSYIYRWERGGNVTATHFGTLLTLLSSWHFLSSAGVLDNGELNTHLPVATHVQLYQALSIGCTRTIQEHISEQQSYFYKILFLFFLDGRADGRKKTSLLASKETSSWKQFISNRRSGTVMLGFSHPHVMCPEPLETRKEYHIWLAGTTR